MMKWLRVIFCRDTTLKQTFLIWDYLFSDVNYEMLQARQYEEKLPSLANFYTRDSYLTSKNDYLCNVDYYSLAIMISHRDELMEADGVEILPVFSNSCCGDPSLIEVAERIKRVVRCESVGNFPLDITKVIPRIEKS